MLIDKDITVKVTHRAQIQFWSSRPDAAQTVWRPAHLRVEGTLDIQGAPTEPVRLFPSALFPTRLVEIRKGNSSAVIHMSYADVANPWLEGDGDTAWNTVSYNYFYRNYPSEYLIGNNVSATVPSELGSGTALHWCQVFNQSLELLRVIAFTDSRWSASVFVAIACSI